MLSAYSIEISLKKFAVFFIIVVGTSLCTFICKLFLSHGSLINIITLTRVIAAGIACEQCINKQHKNHKLHLKYFMNFTINSAVFKALLIHLHVYSSERSMTAFRVLWITKLLFCETCPIYIGEKSRESGRSV